MYHRLRSCTHRNVYHMETMKWYWSGRGDHHWILLCHYRLASMYRQAQRRCDQRSYDLPRLPHADR